MTTHDDEYRGTTQFDNTGYTGSPPTNRLLRDDEYGDEPGGEVDRSTRWHGGLDLGLLLLRIGLGATMGAHGLQKAFGLFNGPGVDGFAQILAGHGYTHATLLSWLTALTEIVGGAMLVLGLFTPLGAAALLGVLANAVYVKHTGGFFLGRQAQGFEFDLLLAVVALSLLFTGPGRLALDVNTPWRRRPMPFGLTGLLLAAAATAVIMVLFR